MGRSKTDLRGSRTIMCKGIGIEETEQQIQMFLSTFGPISAIRIDPNKPGYAWVEFAYHHSACNALNLGTMEGLPGWFTMHKCKSRIHNPTAMFSLSSHTEKSEENNSAPANSGLALIDNDPTMVHSAGVRESATPHYGQSLGSLQTLLLNAGVKVEESELEAVVQVDENPEVVHTDNTLVKTTNLKQKRRRPRRPQPPTPRSRAYRSQPSEPYEYRVIGARPSRARLVALAPEGLYSICFSCVNFRFTFPNCRACNSRIVTLNPHQAVGMVESLLPNAPWGKIGKWIYHLGNEPGFRSICARLVLHRLTKLKSFELKEFYTAFFEEARMTGDRVWFLSSIFSRRDVQDVITVFNSHNSDLAANVEDWLTDF